jgi:hypothetical protein
MALRGDRRRTRPGAVVVAGSAALFAACGGGTTSPNPNPNPSVGDSTVVSVDLGIGQGQAVTADGKILKIELPAASGAREYRLAVQSAAQTTASTSMKLVTSASGSGAADVVPRLSAAQVPGFDRSQRWVQRDLMELRLRRNIRTFLRGRQLQPARPGGGLPQVGLALAAPVVPASGDTLHLTYPVKQSDLTITCDTAQASPITAVVRKVGQRAIFVADTGNSSDFSAADYQQLADEFDNYIFAIDSAYFGGPADIDNNGHVIVLFTREVNALTPKGSGTYIGGFFIPTDLAARDSTSTAGNSASGYCPTSNEAELLYLQAPDPSGTFSDPVAVDDAKRNARSVSAHEFQHLLGAEDRLIKSNGTFGDLNDVWLDEGLSHVAEEMVGLAAGGHGVRQDLTFNEVTGSAPAPIDPTTQTQTDVFNTFFLDDFGRLARYFLDPSGTQTVALKDPAGLESLKMRGFAWVFLRWLGDHFGPAGSGTVPGSDEEVLFRRLASGGASHQAGIDNVIGAIQEVTGEQVTWPELLADFAIMPAVDDAGVSLVSSRQDLPTWALRNIFLGLHSNAGTGQNPEFQMAYPLDITSAGFVDDTISFDVRGSAESYFQFGGTGPVPDFVLRLTDPSGAALSASTAAQITIVRTQ